MVFFFWPRFHATKKILQYINFLDLQISSRSYLFPWIAKDINLLVPISNITSALIFLKKNKREILANWSKLRPNYQFSPHHLTDPTSDHLYKYETRPVHVVGANY